MSRALLVSYRISRIGVQQGRVGKGPFAEHAVVWFAIQIFLLIVWKKVPFFDRTLPSFLGLLPVMFQKLRPFTMVRCTVPMLQSHAATMPVSCLRQAPIETTAVTRTGPRSATYVSDSDLMTNLSVEIGEYRVS
jgi:hypothetical protein